MRTPGADGKLVVGKCEVVSFSDAIAPFPLPLADAFPAVRDDDWVRYRSLYPGSFRGQALLCRVSCTVVRSPGTVTLIDTGVGPADTAFARFLGTGGSLLERLREAGIEPDDVDIVFMTHLHADHVGWNVRQDGTGEPVFPNARYLAPYADWSYALSRSDSQPYVAENLLPLDRAGVLELIEPPLALCDFVVALETAGHTPGHLSVAVEAPDRRVYLLGDAVAHPLQLTDPEQAFVFDADPERARLTRHALLERIRTEDALVSACHFPRPGIGRVGYVDGAWIWMPCASYG